LDGEVEEVGIDEDAEGTNEVDLKKLCTKPIRGKAIRNGDYNHPTVIPPRHRLRQMRLKIPDFQKDKIRIRCHQNDELASMILPITKAGT